MTAKKKLSLHIGISVLLICSILFIVLRIIICPGYKRYH